MRGTIVIVVYGAFRASLRMTICHGALECFIRNHQEDQLHEPIDLFETG
jgi:hypothetical protein